MRIIGGLFIAALGVVVIFYASSLAKMFGRRVWAENHLWGTMQWYVIIGFVIIIMGIMTMFGGQFVQPDPTGFQIIE